MRPQQKKQWDYGSDRVLIEGSAFAGLAVFGVGLCSLFPPVIAGAALVWGMLRSLKEIRQTRSFIRSMSSQLGKEDPLPPGVVDGITEDIAIRMGRASPPMIVVTPPQDLNIEDRDARKFFAAIPDSNILETTPEALAYWEKKPEMLRFIAAHEMSHLQADRIGFFDFGQDTVGQASYFLWAAIPTALLLGVFGVVPSLSLAPAAILGFCVLKKVADAAISFASRVRERQADRNALYVTRDLESAERVMSRLYAGRSNNASDIFSTHPGFQQRVTSLRRAFNAVSQYPALKPIASVSERRMSV